MVRIYNQEILAPMIQHQLQHQLLKQVPTALLCMSLSSRHWSQNPAHQKHQVSLLSHIPDVLDVLPKQSSGALATGAMRVATAMYQLELKTLIHFTKWHNFQWHWQCDMSCVWSGNKQDQTITLIFARLKFQTSVEHPPSSYSPPAGSVLPHLLSHFFLKKNLDHGLSNFRQVLATIIRHKAPKYSAFLFVSIR